MKRLTVLFVALAVVGFGTMTASARILNVPQDYQTIQSGIDSAQNGDTVLVQPGVYQKVVVNFRSRTITLASQYLLLGDSTFIDSTIIDGESRYSAVSLDGQEPHNATVIGFTIRNGQGNDGGGISLQHGRGAIFHSKIINNIASEYGGGISCLNGASLWASDLLVTGNHANHAGGGITIKAGGLSTLERSLISNNSAGGAGGGLHVGETHGVFINNCVISDNESLYGGGVFADLGSTLEIYNTNVSLNMASSEGGGIMLDDNGNITLKRVLVFNNSSNGYGGGITALGWQIILTQLTIMANSAEDGAALWFDNGSNVILTSSIIGNQGQTAIFCRPGGSQNQLAISYSYINGGRDVLAVNENADTTWGDGNINADPLFADPANGDYHLSPNSPCIDAGDPDSPHDPDGTRSDMGAFYFHQRDIRVEPLALHFLPIVWGEIDSLPVEIRNEGGSDLLLRGVGVPLQWSCIWPAGLDSILDTLEVIAPDSTFILWVYCQPDLGGVLENTITVYSDDPDEPEVEIEAAGEINGVPSDHLHPSIFNLQSAYPNPFNSTTSVFFDLPHPSFVSIHVFDLSGRSVATLAEGQLQAGRHEVVWNAGAACAGVYLVRMEAGSFNSVCKVLLVK